MRELYVEGARLAALIDSGCTRTLVHWSVCSQWRRGAARVVTVSGQQLECAGTGDVQIVVPGCQAVMVSALVVGEKPLGFGVIVGMDAVQALGGVTVRSPSDVRFGCEASVECAAAAEGSRQPGELRAERESFCVRFDPVRRRWVVSWKWAGGSPPCELFSAVDEYPMPAEARAEYEAELDSWIRNGWLCEYDEGRLGPPKGSIPLMAVVQRTKVRPVLDFRPLNRYVTAFTADADVCAEKLRRWRQMGPAVALLDLKKAFLQVHVEEALWPYQTVWFRGRRLALTRLGFGLSISPSVMQAVLDLAVAQDPRVAAAVSTYADDILVDEAKLPASDVAEHLRAYGLESKPPERAKDGARILGLRVWGEPTGALRWSRDNQLKGVERPLTRRRIFSICGQLVSHHPVCSWLRPAASFLKRLISEVTSGWDDPVENASVLRLAEELVARVKADDPAKGRWDVSGDTVTVWSDASSLALGAAVEVDGEVVEDASWLRRPGDEAHINLAELDAVLKGMNMALQWRAVNIDLVTDSRTVLQWVTDVLSGRARLRSKAASEMLIRRRLCTLKSLVDEYGLNVRVRCVPSASNRADALTRVPESWLKTRTADGAEAGAAAGGSGEAAVCSAAAGSAAAVVPGGADGARSAAGRAPAAREGAGGTNAAEDSRCSDDDGLRKEVKRIHHTSGHPGVRRTFLFAKRALPDVTKSVVREVVSACETCRSIDPAPVKWKAGDLSVESVWERVAMDMTHYRGETYLTLIDCGPSRFTIWRPLRLQTSAAVVDQLESVFWERGAPRELLTDNDPAFRSRRFRALTVRWGVKVRFRCAHVPSGNAVIERCHRSVKVIAARKGCSITEAVFRYNVMPRDDETADSAPASRLYRYQVRVQGLDSESHEPEVTGTGRLSPADKVWVRPPDYRCDRRYEKGEVTRVVSDQCVEVDGVPRHVRELRPRASSESSDSSAEESERGEPAMLWTGGTEAHDDSAVENAGEGAQIGQASPRRSQRVRQPRRPCTCEGC